MDLVSDILSLNSLPLTGPGMDAVVSITKWTSWTLLIRIYNGGLYF